MFSIFPSFNFVDFSQQESVADPDWARDTSRKDLKHKILRDLILDILNDHGEGRHRNSALFDKFITAIQDRTFHRAGASVGIEFVFEDFGYTLINTLVAGNPALVLQAKNDTKFKYTFENHRIDELTNRYDLLHISKKVNPEAQSQFAPLFQIATSNNASRARSPIMSGHVEDSIARQIVLGMQAGIVTITPIGIDLLVDLINAEVSYLDLKIKNPAQAQRVWNSLEPKARALSQHFNYQRGHTGLVIQNDYQHNHLNYWPDGVNEVRQQMIKNGVTFLINGDVDQSPGRPSNRPAAVRHTQAEIDGFIGKNSLAAVFGWLDTVAQKTFLSLFKLSKSYGADDKSAIVSGDIDGSIARQILLGMHAGIITIDAIGINLLAELINAESKCLDNSDQTQWPDLTQLQQNEADLIKHLTFKSSPLISPTFNLDQTKLIIRGDDKKNRFAYSQTKQPIRQPVAADVNSLKTTETAANPELNCKNYSSNSSKTCVSHSTPTSPGTVVREKLSKNGAVYIVRSDDTQKLDPNHGSDSSDQTQMPTASKKANKNVKSMLIESTLPRLFEQLSTKAKELFLPLFSIPVNDQLNGAPPVIASEHIDGSIARQVVLGIQAGIIRINQTGIDLLAELINLETQYCDKANQQVWQHLQQKASELVKHLTYHTAHTCLVVQDGHQNNYLNYCPEDIKQVREKMIEEDVTFLISCDDAPPGNRCPKAPAASRSKQEKIDELFRANPFPALFGQISEKAKSLFLALFNIPADVQAHEKSTIVAENIEGSIARQVLLGMQAGIIKISRAGMYLLAELIDLETSYHHKNDQTTWLSLQQKSRELRPQLSYQTGHTALIIQHGYQDNCFNYCPDEANAIRKQMIQHGATFLIHGDDAPSDNRRPNVPLANKRAEAKALLEANALAVLFGQMSDAARRAYLPLLSIKAEHNAKSTIVSGHIEGSMARQIVLGMQAGIVKIAPTGIYLLVEIINAEINFLEKNDQAAWTFLQRASELSQHLSYQRGHTDLVIENGYHDNRLNYCPAGVNEVRQHMTKHGATFLIDSDDVLSTSRSVHAPQASRQAAIDDLIKENALAAIFGQIDTSAQKTFLSLFKIPKAYPATSRSPIVSGDIDGSIARQILLGIQAGIIAIDVIGINLLVELINAENKHLIGTDLAGEPDIKLLQQKTTDLAKHLTFKSSETKLIIRIDTQRNRFSYNQPVEQSIREKMSKNGAVYIPQFDDAQKSNANDGSHSSEQAPLASRQGNVSLILEEGKLPCLFEQLSAEAKSLFSPLFKIPLEAKANHKSAIVSGDINGSMARQIILGIQAGMIEITQTDMHLLAELINLESACINNQDDLLVAEQFQQKNAELVLIIDQLKFKPGHTSLIIRGDSKRNRFLHNQTVDRVRQQMEKSGAVYTIRSEETQKLDADFGSDPSNYAPTAIRRADIEPLLTKSVLPRLFEQISVEARKMFLPLFNLALDGQANDKSMIVSGHINGSIARQILLGMQADMVVQMSQSHIDLLAQLINLETTYSHQNDPAVWLQLQRKARELAQQLIYQPSYTGLVIYSDYRHNRFDYLDSGIEYQVRQSMIKNGATFIVNFDDALPAPIDVPMSSKRVKMDSAGPNLFSHLFGQLSPRAREEFLELLKVDTTNRSSPQSLLVSSDIRGSTASQIVLGIQVGIIKINLEGIALLAAFMNAEVDVMANSSNSSRAPLVDHTPLLKELTYQEGHTQLVIQYSNDKSRQACLSIDNEVRSKMENGGVCYSKRSTSHAQSNSPTHWEGMSSLPEYRARGAIALLSGPTSKLTQEAKDIFNPLFDIQEIGQIDEQTPLVLGDADGSIARQIVLGIQAGIVEIDQGGIPLLAALINAEAKAMVEGKHARVKFQKNLDNQVNIAKLAKHLTYKRGYAPLIFIGDCVHDRLSCNKDVEREIREQMHACGAIFVTGNHDIPRARHANNIDQFGSAALDTGTEEDWVKHHKKVFCNAHYHKKTNTLYLHHGAKLAKKNGAKFIETAFNLNHNPLATYALSDPFDPVKFVEHLNAGSLNSAWSDFNDFRPERDKVEQLAKALKVRIVYGHNGDMNTSSRHALAINSRENGKLRTSAVRIGLIE